MLHDVATFAFGGVCLAIILSINITQIVLHLRNYTEPLYQRYILRIIFIVPVTAITAFLAIIMPENSIWFDASRQWYEAWVIYNFMCLLLAYVGGEGQVQLKLDGKQIKPSCLTCTCCINPSLLVVNGRYVRWCKRLTLQFVFTITPLSILTVILFEKGIYEEGNWGLNHSYIYIQVLYNISYAMALSALFMFYHGTHELLAPFKPVLKFVVIKGVVFLTFWQGILCSILHGVGVIETADEARSLQSFLILIEMVVAAILMAYAFPHKEFVIAEGRSGGVVATSDIRHAISIHDVVSDTYHSFAPAYHDYVLYSDGTGKSPKAGGSAKKGKKVRKQFRARTFLMMGQESSTTHQGHEVNLMKDVEMGAWDSATSEPEEEKEAGPSSGSAPDADLSSIQEDPWADDASDDVSEEQVQVDLSGDTTMMGNASLGVRLDDSREEEEASDVESSEQQAAGLSAVAKEQKTWMHIDLK